ncbi:hypothetical protein TRL7639_00551 [Falsiruegeria litorea R37]|uniref:O-GlcNAc transferase C-terminal domain-containing protein n=1 Tax=Falsiruegeria litorea R37 TaxID=1200284 RepID=A0A1Y5RRY2_9RHOB|nr:hypothetical protein [Falsiruegeria litorea]SLN21144.1 hypothetical protein TRL7639_00551 [Falsiruegeria litorea R37]
MVNAHTTASNALWAGVPMITRPGQQFAARVGASLVQAAGVPQLVADSDAAYEALALRLATEPEQLKALQAKLHTARQSCSLFDAGRYVRNLETAFRQATDRWRAGLPPQDFAVMDHTSR